jgi:response regulator NasT
MRILLFEDSGDTLAELTETLTAAGHEVLETERSARYLADRVDALAPDLVILAADSPSRDTMEQVCLLTERAPRPIVLLTEDVSPAAMRRALRAGISAYVAAGLPPDQVETVMQLAQARFEEDQRLREAVRQAEDRLAERKHIERAKGLLMSERKCDEAEAYRLLRRMAMDRNLKLGELAQQVIAVSELLRN